MATDKTIGGWLVVDWRKGQHRTRKSKPKASELGKNELLARLKINVTIPEVEVSTLAVDIDVPEPHVQSAILEALSDEELPDWTDVVAEQVEAFGGVDAAKTEWPNSRDIITGRSLVEMNVRPDPQKVQDYVDAVLRGEADDGA